MKNWRNIVCVTTIYKRRASTQGEDELKVVHSFRWKQNIFRIIPAPMLLLILADWDSFYSSSGNVLKIQNKETIDSGYDLKPIYCTDKRRIGNPVSLGEQQFQRLAVLGLADLGIVETFGSGSLPRAVVLD